MKTYRIRPLIWTEAKGLPRSETWTCRFTVTRHPVSGYWLTCDSLRAFGKQRCETLEEARAAAEEWYLERLLPALEEVDG